MKAALAAIAVAALLPHSLAGPLHAVPPPPEQFTADCARPVYASDRLVCQTPDLLEVDRKLAAKIAAPDTVAPSADNGFAEGHGEWFRRRSRCAMQVEHRECLLAAYADRSDTLEAMGRSVAVAGRLYTCRFGDISREVRLFVAHPGMMLIGDSSGTVLGRAYAAKPGNGWRPYLSFRLRRQNVELSNTRDEAMSCELFRSRG